MAEPTTPAAAPTVAQAAAKPQPAQPAATAPVPESGAGAAPPPLLAPDGAQGGLLARLNPVRLFRRATPLRHVAEGNALIERKNFAQAMIAFSKALALDPNCGEAYAGLGASMARKGSRSALEAALTNFGEAIARNPFAEHYYVATARIYERLGKRKEATLERKKMIIVKTLATDANNAVANNNMGILLLQQQQVAAALNHFERAIATDPKYDVALRNHATALLQLAIKQRDEAKRAELFEKAQVLAARALDVAASVPSLLLMAKLLLARGNTEEALSACTQAEAQDEANHHVYALKKIVLERMNRMEEARIAYDKYMLYAGAK
ncbi:MAG: tetratricopeptide repeat protein [Candidatus Lambdaproteobacteria bacterium]|nr:tetratricopeptide repeat protein [Candidatus Lambdaproteobacteria bacterium]